MEERSLKMENNEEIIKILTATSALIKGTYEYINMCISEELPEECVLDSIYSLEKALWAMKETKKKFNIKTEKSPIEKMRDRAKARRAN